jgi:hypothetical protein
VLCGGFGLLIYNLYQTVVVEQFNKEGHMHQTMRRLGHNLLLGKNTKITPIEPFMCETIPFDGLMWILYPSHRILMDL